MTQTKDAGKFHTRDIHSLLIVELTRLGDLVIILPALQILRKEIPRATIHVLVDTRYAPLVAALGGGFEVHGVPDPASVRGMMSAIRIARQIRPDIACSMSPAQRNVAVALTSGAQCKAGYLTHLDSLTPFLHNTQVASIDSSRNGQLSYGRESITQRPMKVLQALGCDTSAHDGTVTLREERADGSRDDFRVTASVPTGNYMAVHPFSAWTYRTWPSDRFVELTQRVVNNLGCDVVFVCSKDEENSLEPLRQQLDGLGKIHFVMAMSILETAAILRNALVFLGNDSGPLHLAAILGTKVVGLFGPAPPSLTAPGKSAGVYLYHEVECSPCDQRKCIRPEAPCIGLITVDEAFSAVAQQLAIANAEQTPANG